MGHLRVDEGLGRVRISVAWARSAPAETIAIPVTPAPPGVSGLFAFELGSWGDRWQECPVRSAGVEHCPDPEVDEGPEPERENRR